MAIRAFILAFLIHSLSVVGQESNSLDFDENYKDKWIYFSLDSATEMKVWAHVPGGPCGTRAFASITLAVTNENDTVRVLDLCNTSEDFNSGDDIIVKPAKKPSFNVSLPAFFVEDTVTGKIKNAPWDVRILKTTYGELSKK